MPRPSEAELFELHDRFRFWSTASSYVPDAALSAATCRAFEHFVELRELSDGGRRSKNI